MLRSMFSAISGLRGNQVYMDVIGNNIANVNTTAYKTTRATFASTLSQTIRPASSPQIERGGINPAQVGLGSALASVDTIFSQGDLKSTGRLTDLAIQGEGFFMLSDGQRRVYTRDGTFDTGVDGSLLSNSTGLKVQGWTFNPATNQIDMTQPLGEITIPVGGRSPAEGTSTATFTGNLDSRAIYDPVNPPHVTSVLEVYDSLGATHAITLTFTKANPATNPNTWAWTASENDAAITSIAGSGSITFDATGKATSGIAGNLTIDYAPTTGITTDQTVALNLSAITQVSSTSEVFLSSKNGFGAGMFLTFSIDRAGVVTGLYSNGDRRNLAQIALASFNNPGGLMRIGNNGYETSTNSGDPIVSLAGTNGLGEINSGYVESANVDLAQQFTDMITASRGFQANSRVITTADEMLQELVNLKR